jgi:hypothetical protein
MPFHEQKSCPRCEKGFECKAGDVTNCQCNPVSLTIEERAFIEDRYSDCLCIHCLFEMKNRYIAFKEKFWINGR